MRKKKCDERKPICRGCERNGFECEYPVPHPSKTVRDRSPPASKLAATFESQQTNIQDPVPESESEARSSNLQGQEMIDIIRESWSPILPEHSPSLRARPSFSSRLSPSSTGPLLEYRNRNRDRDPFAYDPAEASSNRATLPSTSTALHYDHSSAGYESERDEVAVVESMLLASPKTVPRRLGQRMVIESSWPDRMSNIQENNGDAVELLGYYCSRTAMSMSNGFQSANPFLTELIPLAFSNDLILRLMLAQTAAHRTILHQTNANEIALNHYSKSINQFRREIKDHILRKTPNSLFLAVGALILCFTETTKGDVNGAVFDHLSAATFLLAECLLAHSSTTPAGLRNFLVEYYIYTATLSMISVDTRHSSQSILSPELEQLGHTLVESQYVGNLCGCWLELLLVIPQIFELGRRWRLVESNADENSNNNVRSDELAECVVIFASLQNRILLWLPYPCENPDGAVVALIFKQALLLYLYTALDGCWYGKTGRYSALIEETVSTAMQLLDTLTPTAQINTSICWPIAVVGSCLTDKICQQKIANRLQSMLSTIGLGNMRQTLKVLEHVWKKPFRDMGPWNICRVMQDHEIWISFA
ncbi:hypothetical protein BP6252_12102 [Coleophoma cylindrospora]|uniref:Zn(2)-C6 fungal-type domain-containing protein n=1 Tax=Coleophoma cylindrospora TaxID=1849047 RepID=A0A3D8QG05_9HELO|nr:hypothetical protein BP6252_12102 [Coleophoma cylindrospora]